ncbi:MAG: hypothetical protein JRK53_21215 [Deltaproteobacteria bacterium]|nr:hypothetical protein [Deltaproteobacteria bacterium]
MNKMYIKFSRILILAVIMGLFIVGFSSPGLSQGQTLSPAERLIGIWKAVDLSGKAFTEQGVTDLEMTFTAEGRWTQKVLMRDEKGMEFDEKNAAYKVQGDKITFHEPGDTRGTFNFAFEGEDLIIRMGGNSMVIRMQRLN